jgi:uncharacterized protein with PIN domain
MDQPRFLADAMLGRLARWLRVLGVDAAYDATAPDAALVRRAAAEDRVFLTRDRHLLRELRPARAIAIESDAPLEQLGQVIASVPLEPPRELFARCLLCNVPLEELPESERHGRVPPASRGLPGPVRRCPNCERVYWPGSHVRRMRRALERALPGWLPHAGDPPS